MRFLLHGCGLLALTASTVTAKEFRLANSEPGARLPKPMSDMSAVVGPDNLIYIAGGCDSPFGSQFNEDAGAFRCNSVSDSFYSFDPETQEFTVLPPMPEGRYRHAAVSVNNQIWVVGGRDQFDDLVGDVHVYDLEDMRWRTFRDLHESYWLSDLGGFTAGGRAYFAGGFAENYRAVRKVFSINPRRSWEDGRLRIVRHSNLIHRRGDVGVTVDEEERFAYVSGGSSHTNNFCSPLSTVEKYDLKFNHWEEVAPLTHERTGKTVVQLNDQLVALGGAQQISKLCNKTNSDPSDMQTPVYEVEVYDQAEWTVVDKLADYRFRSTTVVYNNTVYSFGGQSVYFSVCMCHPTVDTVVTYQQTAVLEVPGQPGDTFANEGTYDFDFQHSDQGFVVAQPPQDSSQPGADTIYSPSSQEGAETDYDPEYIEERGNFDGDEKYEEDTDGAQQSGYGSTQSGFGGYHRDKSNGFTGASSGSTIVPPSFLYTAIIGVLATIVL